MPPMIAPVWLEEEEVGLYVDVDEDDDELVLEGGNLVVWNTI